MSEHGPFQLEGPVKPPADNARSCCTEPEAVQRLFLRNIREIRAYARGMLPPHFDVDDVVQDGFIAAMESSERYVFGAPFLPWAFGIIRNKVLERLRKDRLSREHALSVEALNQLAARAGAVESFETRVAALDRCIEKLAPAAYRVLRLFYFQGLDARSIAARLGITRKTVYKGLDRARFRLRDCVEREMKGDGA